MSKTKTKLPPILDPDEEIPTSASWECAVIDKFLRDALIKVELSLNDHRVQAMHDRTDRLRGLIEYFRHQKSTLEDLIAQNQSRHASERPRRSPGRRPARS